MRILFRKYDPISNAHRSLLGRIPWTLGALTKRSYNQTSINNYKINQEILSHSSSRILQQYLLEKKDQFNIVNCITALSKLQKHKDIDLDIQTSIHEALNKKIHHSLKSSSKVTLPTLEALISSQEEEALNSAIPISSLPLSPANATRLISLLIPFLLPSQNPPSSPPSNIPLEASTALAPLIISLLNNALLCFTLQCISSSDQISSHDFSQFSHFLYHLCSRRRNTVGEGEGLWFEKTNYCALPYILYAMRASLQRSSNDREWLPLHIALSCRMISLIQQSPASSSFTEELRLTLSLLLRTLKNDLESFTVLLHTSPPYDSPNLHRALTLTNVFLNSPSFGIAAHPKKTQSSHGSLRGHRTLPEQKTEESTQRRGEDDSDNKRDALSETEKMRCALHAFSHCSHIIQSAANLSDCFSNQKLKFDSSFFSTTQLIDTAVLPLLSILRQPKVISFLRDIKRRCSTESFTIHVFDAFYLYCYSLCRLLADSSFLKALGKEREACKELLSLLLPLLVSLGDASLLQRSYVIYSFAILSSQERTNSSFENVEEGIEREDGKVGEDIAIGGDVMVAGYTKAVIESMRRRVEDVMELMEEPQENRKEELMQEIESSGAPLVLAGVNRMLHRSFLSEDKEKIVISYAALLQCLATFYGVRRTKQIILLTLLAKDLKGEQKKKRQRYKTLRQLDKVIRQLNQRS